MFGAREAAWPLIRTDLALTYTQIGVLLAAPNVVSHVLEPAIGILGDVWDRRRLILGGGVFFTIAVALAAVSPGFLLLLAAFSVGYPASGAFVSLSQATLMDMDPSRREQNMARWGFAGHVGALLGTLSLAGAVRVGAGWRGLFALLTGASLLALAAVWKPVGQAAAKPSHPLRAADLAQGIAGVLASLRRLAVVRWLVLLELSDLMLDGMHGFLALYFVDVAKMSEATAALGVAAWVAAGLAGSMMLIPLVERVPGLVYLRYSALLQAVLFAVFLLAPSPPAKLVAAVLLGLSSAGWYPVLKAQVYSAMPGRSGTVMAVGNVSGMVSSVMPLGLGLAASAWGLGPTMWLLIAGPIAIAVGLPRGRG